MADEEDFELEAQHLLQQASKAREKVHRIIIGWHDTDKAKTNEIVEIAVKVLDSLPEEHSHKDLATALKWKLDDVYGGTWHVIVGTHFGGNVTNDEETLVNFKIDGINILTLRSGPPERPLEANAAKVAMHDNGNAATVNTISV